MRAGYESVVKIYMDINETQKLEKDLKILIKDSEKFDREWKHDVAKQLMKKLQEVLESLR